MKSRTAVFVLIAIFLLTACKPENEESAPSQTPSPQTGTVVLRSSDISFWHPFSAQSAAGKFLQDQIEAFNLNHPDNQIVSQPVGSCEIILREIDESSTDGSLPGLVWICFGANRAFQETASPIDLQTISSSDQLQNVLTGFDPLLLEAISSSEGTAAIPLNISTPVIFYRTDLFTQSGLDPLSVSAGWDNVLNAAYLLHDNTNATGLTLGLDSTWMMELLLAEEGGRMLDSSGIPVFNDRSVMGSLEKTAGLFADEAATISETPAHAATALKNGTVGMAVLSHEWGAELMGSAEIGVIPWPQNSVSAADIPFSGGSLYILAEEQIKQQTALEFVLYLIEDERLIQWSEQAGILPARSAALDAVRGSGASAVVDSAITVYDHGAIRTEYGIPYLAVQEIFTSTLDDILLQSVDTDEGLTEAFLKLSDRMGN